jgi:hypothetical protein
MPNILPCVEDENINALDKAHVKAVEPVKNPVFYGGAAGGGCWKY